MTSFFKSNDYSDKNQPATSPHTLFVSLYLVILAFFILLNSVSEVDKIKTQKTIFSIERVFAGGIGYSDIKDQDDIFEFPQIVANYFDSFEQLMKTSFQLQQMDAQRSGNKMRITIPLQQYFQPNSAKLLRGKKKIFKKMAKLLQQDRKGAFVIVAISVDSMGFASKENASYKIDKERLKFIVKSLIANGVPADQVVGAITFNNEKNFVIESTVQRSLEDEDADG